MTNIAPNGAHKHTWAGPEIGKDGKVFLERTTARARVSKIRKHGMSSEIAKGQSWEIQKGRVEAKPQKLLNTILINRVIFCK